MSLLTPFQLVCDVVMIAGLTYLWVAYWLGKRGGEGNDCE